MSYAQLALKNGSKEGKKDDHPVDNLNCHSYRKIIAKDKMSSEILPP